MSRGQADASEAATLSAEVVATVVDVDRRAADGMSLDSDFAARPKVAAAPVVVETSAAVGVAAQAPLPRVALPVELQDHVPVVVGASAFVGVATQAPLLRVALFAELQDHVPVVVAPVLSNDTPCRESHAVVASLFLLLPAETSTVP